MQQVYCAFLRGVNVNGHTVKMEDIRSLFIAEGQENVCSILATGNLLFTSVLPKKELALKLTRALSTHYKYEANLFLKSASEVQRIVENIPFTPDASLHIYAFISEDTSAQAILEEFKKIHPFPQECAALKNHQFYWQVPKGDTLNTEFSKILGRKDFRVLFTSRNINTMIKVNTKMQRMLM